MGTSRFTSGCGTKMMNPRRNASRFDHNQANLLLSRLEKRAAFFFGNLDVYINIVGSLRLGETAYKLGCTPCHRFIAAK